MVMGWRTGCPPAPAGLKRDVVLEAISTIILDSRFRACMLLCSPAIYGHFSHRGIFYDVQGCQKCLEYSGEDRSPAISGRGTQARLTTSSPVVVVSLQPKALASHHTIPAAWILLLGEKSYARSSSGSAYWLEYFRADVGSPSSEDAEEAESPWSPGLYISSGHLEPLEKGLASSVLASLFKARFANRNGRPAIGALVVPVLCRLIENT